MKAAKKKDEQVLFGLNACLAAAKVRPDAIIRAYVAKERLSLFKEALKVLAAKKRAYHIVTSSELERLTSSLHHEGVSFLLKSPPAAELSDLLEHAGDSGLFVSLVGVSNPHNIGAIARSAAHFGASGLILCEPEAGALSGSAYRVAQGGLEFLSVTTVGRRQLLSLREKGFKLIAPSPHKGTALSRFKFPKKSILLFGEEGAGLSPAIESAADQLVTIPGSGSVESLNVSGAAVAFLYEWHRQRRS